MLLNYGGFYGWLNHPWGWIVYGLVIRDTLYQTQKEETILSNYCTNDHRLYQKNVKSKLIPYLW